MFTWKQSLISVILGKRGRMMEKSRWLAGVHMSISSGGLGPDGEDDLGGLMVRRNIFEMKGLQSYFLKRLVRPNCGKSSQADWIQSFVLKVCLLRFFRHLCKK